ncbi:fibronectin type III domain-containing protein [Tautonia rosea]|uniref:fibronectin type III domain-containing protein n=1 Tax=Tautonia rosea TaxID=2728037 RepID=UPI00147430E2|nr:fibronectin type III domain-containing protein [Tautonia rosea]
MELEPRIVLSSIPVLNSLVGAAATVYLDFDGHFQSQWGSYSNIDTPAYDTDGNTSSFTTSEIANITRIWEYVAEDYAPFNVNVTTVEPSTFINGRDLRVVIGGNGSWTGGTYGGVAYVNSFTSSTASVAYVFPKNLGNGNPKYTADASSHEAGHAFGLRHQSKYDSSGNLLETYSTGTDGGRTAPLMGNSYGATRSLWWNGTTSSASTFQDDMAVISRSANGFGYRADDHGNTAGSATPLTISGSTATASGIIGQMSDLDTFSFSTGAGTVSFTVSTPTPVNNLTPRIELRDAGGSTVIATAGPSSNFSATVSANLAAGSYRIVVASDGTYGSVGQYFVNGSIVASTNLINSPSNLTALVQSTSRINLSWTDNATNETGYRVERSTDGTNWTVLTSSLPAGSTSYSDTTTAAGTAYSYRVQAFNASVTSDYSNTASATTVTVAPSGLAASAVSSSRINLSWNDVAGETSYRIERSTNGTTWTLAGTTDAGVTTFSDTGRASNTTYLYRVQALNAGGASAFSSTASATTLDAPSLPNSPTGLTASATSNRVVLNWNDVEGETGYRIERSSNGGKGWSTVGQTSSDVTTYTDSSVSARKTYLYRVYAFNDAGESPASGTVSVTTPSATKGGGQGRGQGNGQSNGLGLNLVSSNGSSSSVIDDFLAFGCGCSLCQAASAATETTPAPDASPEPVRDAMPRTPLLFLADSPNLASLSPAQLPIATPGGGAIDLVDQIVETHSNRRHGLGVGLDRPWWALD